MENLAYSEKANKMLVIASFQELVLNRSSREAILEKGRTSIRPGFGDTFFQKICLNRCILNRIVSYMSNIALFYLMIKRIYRSKHNISVSMILKHFLYYIGIRFCLDVLRGVLSVIMENIVSAFMERLILRDRRILYNLEKNSTWWTTKDGKDFYIDIMAGINRGKTASAIQLCAESCIEHLNRMSENEYRNSSLIHIYDPRMMEWVIPGDENKESSLEEARVLCNECCKRILCASENIQKWVRQIEY